ncbi:hypothetical protein [Bacillus cereus]|uniref:Uncharacterized protein n=1 Tax=Bacillus cereus TaxID=1396 RepID=A0A2A7HUC1_BACCE|nr:hypothetical protein [Bacillus cereus]PEC20586.1 hypothetical protein COM96_18560 [Bacillus cereus]
MQLQTLIRRKSFWIILIGVLIGLITVVSVGVKYVEMKEEKARMEVIEKEKNKAEEEAAAKKKVGKTANNNTIFNIDWKTFKNQWYNSLNSTNRNLSVINDIEEKPSAFSIRHDGQISRALFVSANTDENTEKVVYAVVIGATEKNNVDRNTAVLIASANLINLTDQSLTAEERKEIILEHLGLGDGVILKEKSLSYSYNGITYKAEYEQGNESLGTLTVSVEKNNN